MIKRKLLGKKKKKNEKKELLEKRKKGVLGLKIKFLVEKIYLLVVQKEGLQKEKKIKLKNQSKKHLVQ
jgi:hypothetical protein